MSTNAERIRQNADMDFAITDEDMALLDGLNDAEK